jgi:glycosyltransferase involved in cell wall biosynthesis
MYAQDEIARLADVPANTALLQRWQSASANWLTPVPDTQHVLHLLLQAFTTYLDRCDGGARLIMIDDGAAAPAIAALRVAIADSGCTPHIELLVDANDACIKAALLSADALLLFDANRPLARDAMVLGTPIVGVGAPTAVAEAALLWQDANADLLAASLERLRSDAALRALLRARGFSQAMRVRTDTDRGVSA